MGINTSRFKTDRELLSIRLMQLGERSERAILAEMRAGADEIAQEAKDNAPVDEGSLEDSIKVIEDREGINRRTQVSVIVDEGHLDDKGRQVGEYAHIMHELLEPYGSGRFNLGPNSLAKDSGSGKVGGKYLERAIRSKIGLIGKRIKQAAERVFR